MKRVFFLGLACLLAVLFSATSAVAETPTGEPPAKPAEPTVSKLLVAKYELYLNGQLSGSISLTRSLMSDGTIKVDQTQTIKIMREMGGRVEPFELTETEAGHYSADFGLLSKSTTRTEGPNKTIRHIRIVEGKLHFSQTSTGSEIERQFDIPEDYCDESQAVGEMAKAHFAGEKPEPRTFKVFNGDSMNFEPASVRLNGEAEAEVEGEKIVGANVSLTSSGMNTTMIIDRDMMMLAADTAGIVKIKRVTKPGELGSGASLSSEIEADQNVKGSKNLVRMEVDLIIKDDQNSDEALFESGPYQEVISRKDGHCRITLLNSLPDPEKQLEAAKLPMADLPESISRFLKPTPLCQSDDDGIVAKAKELVGEIDCSEKASKTLVNWVHRNMTFDAAARGNASAVESLKSLKGDCTEHAALLVALARAAGIPARNAVGVAYLSAGSRALWGYHQWAEVWIGRWVPVDATVNEFGLGARYLNYGYEEPEMTSAGAKIVRMIGRTKIRIRSSQVKGQAPLSYLSDDEAAQDRPEGEVPPSKPEGEEAPEDPTTR